MDSIKRRVFIKTMGLIFSGAFLTSAFPDRAIAVGRTGKKIHYQQTLFIFKRSIRRYGMCYRDTENSKAFWKQKIKNEAEKYAIYHKRYSRL